MHMCLPIKVWQRRKHAEGLLAHRLPIQRQKMQLLTSMLSEHLLTKPSLEIPQEATAFLLLRGSASYYNLKRGAKQAPPVCRVATCET